MRKIEYVIRDERLITPSGLSLVGQVLGKLNMIKKQIVCGLKNVLDHKSKTGMKMHNMPVRHSTIKHRRQRNARKKSILEYCQILS